MTFLLGFGSFIIATVVFTRWLNREMDNVDNEMEERL